MPYADREKQRHAMIAINARSDAKHREAKLRRKRERRASGKTDRWVKIKLTYGLTKADYYRMFAFQKGVCAICHRPETGKRLGKDIPLAIDHDHALKKGDHGFVRGLLCRHCNVGLGAFQDNVNTMESAIEYLQVNRVPTTD